MGASSTFLVCFHHGAEHQGRRDGTTGRRGGPARGRDQDPRGEGRPAGTEGTAGPARATGRSRREASPVPGTRGLAPAADRSAEQPPQPSGARGAARLRPRRGVILDSSAVIAMLLREPGWEALTERVSQSPQPAIGAATLAETGAVLTARLGITGQTLLERFLVEANLSVIPFT